MDYRREMKRMKIFIFAALIAILSICGFSVEAAVEPPDHVAVYYFYGNFRCANCRNIERYTKEAVEKYFAKELSNSRVSFKVINIEEKGNEHFTDDYKLYTKSVVLSLVKGGKEVRYDNLTKVWEHLRDKKAFYQYIKTEIDKYLKEI